MRSNKRKQVITIDSDSAPRIVHYGEDFLLEQLPIGTRVIYPPQPLAPLQNNAAAIRYALNHPHGCDPLHAQLSPGMKVTIAMDDISLPLPPMAAPDVREQVLTCVLQMLADYGVDDIHMIVATCLHRRMKPHEIKHMVGKRIFRDYFPDRLYNHDAEDPDGIVRLGETHLGEPVELNRRAVESDLIIYVNINLVPMDGGHKSVGVGLCNYRTLLAHHNPKVMRKTKSYMNPDASELHSVVDRVGRVVNEHLNVFHIETVLNNRMYRTQLDFLAKNEDSFNELDWLKFDGMQASLKRLPRVLKRKMLFSVPAAYELVAVHAGATEATHAHTLEACYKQYLVEVDGQADVVVTGIPFISPYNVYAALNPVLVQVMALGYFHNMHMGTPLLKRGGTLIVCHPCVDDFDKEQHPSYIEFFHRLLAETRDAHQLHRKYERAFAAEPSYVHEYRFGHAYHGAHPFFMWYWGEAGRRWVGRVIVAGAQDVNVTRLLGWQAAGSLAEALAMAKSAHGGGSPQVTMMHHPPIVMTDVKA